jgi:2-keto-4-pentenoate hydratase/2-oxohepta-3-ene-1,7-dioic acid hydratase in catechol pathway
VFRGDRERGQLARSLMLTRLWANAPCPHQTGAPVLPPRQRRALMATRATVREQDIHRWQDLQPFLRPGDVVEAEIDGLGRQRQIFREA